MAKGTRGGRRRGGVNSPDFFTSTEEEAKSMLEGKKGLSLMYEKMKVNDLNFFFGKDSWKQKSNKYVYYKAVQDNDNFIIRTNNIKLIKGNLVLVVGNNKAVYLKDWQVRQSRTRDLTEFNLVKLNRKYFKTYTFKNNFDNFSFKKDETFDDLLKVAKKQDKNRVAVRF